MLCVQSAARCDCRGLKESGRGVIEFDEAEHRYSVDGVTVPSVTQIIDAGGLISDFCKSEQAAERGLRIHEACALLARGVLDWSTVDPRIIGYVLSYQRFLEACSSWKVLAVEQRVFGELHRYCGTFDVLFDTAICDLKSGGPAAWHRLQLAAYWAACKEARRSTRRMTIYLNKEGKTARIVEYKDRADLPEFLKLAEAYHERSGNIGI